MSAAGQEGFVTAEWSVGLAVLVLPVVLVVATLPSWAARHAAVSAAAREATRVAVQAHDVTSAEQAAHLAVQEILAGRDITGAVTVEVDLPLGAAPVLPRDGVVAVTVLLPTAPLDLPGLPSLPGPVVGSTHQRSLDPLRSR